MNILKRNYINRILICILIPLIFLISYFLITKHFKNKQPLQITPVVIEETFSTTKNKDNNIDQTAFWHSPNNQHWLVTTAKSTNKLIIYDAITGTHIKDIGRLGNDKLQFSRPNGINIIDDFAFIVERDNHRVQILKLPSFDFLGFIGEKELQKPYGLDIYKENGNYMLYVTDSYDAKTVQDMDKRVRLYSVEINEDSLRTKLLNSFGHEKGVQTLYKVESILADPTYNRLFISDEDKSQRNIKIYTLDGKFTGKYLGKELFKEDPEGIKLYETNKDNGFIVTTNQSFKENIFYIFDRKSLKPLGAFKSNNILNTDGICITTEKFGPFKDGAFFAVNDDQNIVAINWSNIARQLNLK